MITADKIRTARKALGLTQQGLAEALQVSSGRRVRAWESGEAVPPGPVLVAIELLLEKLRRD